VALMILQLGNRKTQWRSGLGLGLALVLGLLVWIAGYNGGLVDSDEETCRGGRVKHA
jgi:hypothetical protein